MGMPIPGLPENLKVKSFWEKPEGTTGMVVLGLLGLGGFFIAPTVLTGLISILTLGTAAVGQAITLTVMLAIAAFLFMVLTDKKFITLVKYMFKSSVRAMTNIFVETDPIGIMKGYIDDLKDKREVLYNKKRDLAGQISKCKEIIASNEKEIENSMSGAKVAQTKGNASLVALKSRNAGRLTDFNSKLRGTLSKMEIIYQALDKYSNAAETIIEDITSEVKVKKQERDMMLSGYSAIKSAMSILSGGDDERELFDQAMEFVTEDYSKKLGEIDDFMNMSKNTLDGIDLQNGVWEEKALKQLAEWEAKTDSIVLGNDKRLMIEDKSATVPLNFNQKGEDVEYAEFFEKKARV